MYKFYNKDGRWFLFNKYKQATYELKDFWFTWDCLFNN